MQRVCQAKRDDVGFIKKAYLLYRDGFRSMTLGRTLWKIIFIKLFVMFAVLKLFFFPNYLKTNFDTDEQRANHVLQQLAYQPGEGSYQGQ